MKKNLALLLALVLAAALAGCSGKQQYSITYLDLFDTVTVISGTAESQEAFQAATQQVHDALLHYHQLFDIYQDYPGIANLKTVNDRAGIAPVQVDPDIIRLLEDCKAFYTATGGKVNVAMGSVLHLWHEARSSGLRDPAHAALPEFSALEAADQHTAIAAVVLDVEASTVYLQDPLLRLEVGAVAKGWAVQQVAQAAPPGLLLSVGGNVCATGPKDTSGTAWVVGIADPEGGQEYLHTLAITGGSVVTSGDYQRSYTVDGKAYHHIIDPETLYPAEYWASVTVVCDDSGVADVLSTALFLLPQAQGQALLTQARAEAMWVDTVGNRFYSPGFGAFIQA